MNLAKTETGYVSGTIIGEYGKEVAIFRGIPYAAPPVGGLRWKPPQPAPSWDGIRKCTQFSSIAPQSDFPIISPGLPISEDCLYLNVVTPAKNSNDRLPVMVWMHGGGYNMGTGNDKIWNYPRLPLHNVVIVSVNTRLGIIGLLAHPLLSQESPRGVSGNYLFLDLIAALQWVRKNIAAFGGNPDNITIFGESGGGAKVTNMMASPLAKGVFHKAICESGTALGGPLPGKPLKELEASGAELFTKLGVDKAADPLKEARTLSWKKIIEADQALIIEKGGGHLRSLWDAAVDGWFLPDSPDRIFQTGELNAVPLIACANLGELIGPGGLVIPFLIKSYMDMLAGTNKCGVKGYACIFDQVPATWKKEGCVSIHSMELTYVFGDWDNSTGWWPSVFMLASQSGARSLDPGLTNADKKVSEAMMAMWAQFAKTGDPNVKDLTNWPDYNLKSDQYLYISEPLQIKSGYSKIVSQNNH